MMGAGLTTIPWGYQQSGLGLGILLTFIAFVASYYTCYLCIITSGEDIDYTQTLEKAFGRKGYYAGMMAFCINLMVPIIIFF
jgi:amino acid permease